jgi:hypothetical protein
MTPPTELVITLPLPVNLANGRMHWREKDRDRKAYFEHCDVLSMTKGIRWLDGEPAKRPAALGFVLHVGNQMDDDNALARVKWAVDWLFTRRFLVEDKRPWCSMSIPSQVITRDKNKQRLEITIKYEDSNG